MKNLKLSQEQLNQEISLKMNFNEAVEIKNSLDFLIAEADKKSIHKSLLDLNCFIMEEISNRIKNQNEKQDIVIKELFFHQLIEAKNSLDLALSDVGYINDFSPALSFSSKLMQKISNMMVD